MIEIIIPIPPTAQMRARTKRQGGRPYKCEKQRLREKEIGYYLLPHKPKEPMTEAVQLLIKCEMPIPKSWPEWKKEAARMLDIRPTGTPDLDNMIKQVKDILTSLDFWNDDCQVVSICASEFYSDNPKWILTIYESPPRPTSLAEWKVMNDE